MKFNQRGIVAMASSGRDTNKYGVTLASTRILRPGTEQECSISYRSQFFITYAKQPHLDGNYTIVGRVIDGATDGALDLMEKVTVNEKHRPVQEIKMKGVRLRSVARFALIMLTKGAGRTGHNTCEPDRGKGSRPMTVECQDYADSLYTTHLQRISRHQSNMSFAFV